MLIIRLQRIGKKHQPSYRLVVAERRSKLGAPPVEDLGSYNPQSKQTTIKKDRVLYWVGNGAKPSITAHNLLVKEGVLNSPKIQLKIKVVTKAEEVAPAETTPEAVPAEVATAPEESAS